MQSPSWVLALIGLLSGGLKRRTVCVRCSQPSREGKVVMVVVAQHVATHMNLWCLCSHTAELGQQPAFSKLPD